MKRSKQTLAAFISGSMMLVSVVSGCATDAVRPESQSLIQALPSPPAEAATPAQPSADTLGQLIAPIALYPDALVAQILAAATYPTEVVEANRWMQQHSDLKGDALAKAVDPQVWDPSVKETVTTDGQTVAIECDFGHLHSPGGGFPHAAIPRRGFPHGGFPSGIRSSAFGGFNHGRSTNAVSSRGRASVGGGHVGGGVGGGAHFGGGGHR